MTETLHYVTNIRFRSLAERNPEFVPKALAAAGGDKSKLLIVYCQIGGDLETEVVVRSGKKEKRYKDPERTFGRQSRWAGDNLIADASFQRSPKVLSFGFFLSCCPLQLVRRDELPLAIRLPDDGRNLMHYVLSRAGFLPATIFRLPITVNLALMTVCFFVLQVPKSCVRASAGGLHEYSSLEGRP